MAAKKKLTFEQQLEAVESLIARMENGSLPLEESMKQYEEGMAMLSAMEKELQAATQRLTVIRQNAAGEDEEVPLEDEE
ncbi:MAG: exodeoxyribonuclease VII small subunit [Clostridia bacterium]|nr:exodeoxyribonuclease VII small subunit [Clostridia bacterium]